MSLLTQVIMPPQMLEEDCRATHAPLSQAGQLCAVLWRLPHGSDQSGFLLQTQCCSFPETFAPSPSCFTLSSVSFLGQRPAVNRCTQSKSLSQVLVFRTPSPRGWLSWSGMGSPAFAPPRHLKMEKLSPTLRVPGSKLDRVDQAELPGVGFTSKLLPANCKLLHWL
jgi:hypothetical protein